MVRPAVLGVLAVVLGGLVALVAFAGGPARSFGCVPAGEPVPSGMVRLVGGDGSCGSGLLAVTEARQSLAERFGVRPWAFVAGLVVSGVWFSGPVVLALGVRRLWRSRRSGLGLLVV